MKLDYLEPRHLRLVPEYLLAQSIQQYRQALAVLGRHPSVDSLPLQRRLAETILQIEEELERRVDAV